MFEQMRLDVLKRMKIKIFKKKELVFSIQYNTISSILTTPNSITSF